MLGSLAARYRAFGPLGTVALLLISGCTAVLGIEDRRLRASDGGIDTVAEGGSGGTTADGGAAGSGGTRVGPPPPPPACDVVLPSLPGLDGASCTSCLCGQCDLTGIGCAGGDCNPVLGCVLLSGCGDPAACELDSMCGAGAAALLDCLGSCDSCRPGLGCPEGNACSLSDGTMSVCNGGVCDPSASPCATLPDLQACSSSFYPDGLCFAGECGPCVQSGPDPECEAAYGVVKGCCLADGSCGDCSADCGATGTACYTAPGVPTGDGLCFQGQCVQCLGVSGAFDDTCMNNVGGTTLCCSAAHTCVECSSGGCDPTVNGTACTTTSGGNGFCSAGACVTCAAVAGNQDADCQAAYGAAFGCCSAAGDCIPCGGSCAPGQVCTLSTGGAGTCTANGTCGECTSADGTIDPVCTATHGTAAACCFSNLCGGCGAAATCTDAVLNGDESDIDCGGSCMPCPAGASCGGATDCASFVCASGACQTPACDDQLLNGGESDVDCGGACPPCAGGQACAVSSDCQSANCLNNVCGP